MEFRGGGVGKTRPHNICTQKGLVSPEVSPVSLDALCCMMFLFSNLLPSDLAVLFPTHSELWDTQAFGEWSGSKGFLQVAVRIISPNQSFSQHLLHHLEAAGSLVPSASAMHCHRLTLTLAWFMYMCRNQKRRCQPTSWLTVHHRVTGQGRPCPAHLYGAKPD